MGDSFGFKYHGVSFSEDGVVEKCEDDDLTNGNTVLKPTDRDLTTLTQLTDLDNIPAY